MRLKITYKGGDTSVILDAVEVEVETVEGDKRTQAERNADNALAAARLARVEAELDLLAGALRGFAPGVKVAAAAVLSQVEEAQRAPVA